MFSQVKPSQPVLLSIYREMWMPHVKNTLTIWFEKYIKVLASSHPEEKRIAVTAWKRPSAYKLRVKNKLKLLESPSTSTKMVQQESTHNMVNCAVLEPLESPSTWTKTVPQKSVHSMVNCVCCLQTVSLWWINSPQCLRVNWCCLSCNAGSWSDSILTQEEQLTNPS